MAKTDPKKIDDLEDEVAHRRAGQWPKPKPKGPPDDPGPPEEDTP